MSKQIPIFFIIFLIIPIVLIGVFLFSVDEVAAYYVWWPFVGHYEACPRTCIGEPERGFECYNGPNTGDPGSCNNPCVEFGNTWTKYEAVCVQKTVALCDYGYIYKEAFSTADKCVAGEKGLRPGYCGAGSYGSMYKACCYGSAPTTCQNYYDQDDYSPPEGVCPSDASVVYCGFGGYYNCEEACQKTLGSAACTANISANPTSVSSGGSSTLSWNSTDAANCAVYNTTAQTTLSTDITSGSVNSGSLYQTSNFQVQCNSTGSPYGEPECSADVTVNVLSTTCTAILTSDPTTINQGQSSTLSWSSSGASDCTLYIQGSSSLSTGTSGSYNVSPTATTRYEIQCNAQAYPGGNPECSDWEEVTVIPGTVPSNLSATASCFATSSRVNLSWTAGTGSSQTVQRCSGSSCTNFEEIATFSETVTTYIDTVPSYNAIYRYKVCNNAGCSDIVTITSKDCTPRQNTLKVESSPVTGVYIDGGVDYSGFTNYTISTTTDITAALIARAREDPPGYTFSSWSGECNMIGDRVCAVIVSRGQTKTVQAEYVISQDVPVISSCSVSPTSVIQNESTVFYVLATFSNQDGGIDIIRVFRGDGATTDFELRGMISPTSMFRLAGLHTYSSSGSYTVSVRAKGMNGTWSNTLICGTVLVGKSPSDPSATASCSRTDSRVNLSWTAGTGSSQTVQRCSGSSTCTNFNEIATFSETVTTYIDTGLSYNTIYRYRVCNTTGCSGIVTITSSTCSYNLTVGSSPISGISVTGNPSTYGGITSYSKASIPVGTSLSLTATSTFGNYRFSNWSGCDSASGTTCSVTMNSNRTVTANYFLPTYALIVNPAGAGSGKVKFKPPNRTFSLPHSESYNNGTVVTLTGNATSGSVFVGFSGDADCTNGSVTMNADKSCTATFNLIDYTLSVAKSGTGSGTVTSSPAGINCGTDCSETYTPGTIVNLTATPVAGSIFAGWSGDADCTDGSVTMNANKSCTATFSLVSSLPPTGSCLSVSPTSAIQNKNTAFYLDNDFNDPDGPIPAWEIEWETGVTQVVTLNPANGIAHIYDSTGSKTVKLRARDNSDPNTWSSWDTCGMVTVVSPLSVSCEAVPDTTYASRQVEWRSTPSGGTGTYTYFWSGAAVGGTCSTPNTTQNITGCTYSVGGNYSAIVQVQDGLSVASSTCSVKVISVPKWREIIPVGWIIDAIVAMANKIL